MSGPDISLFDATDNVQYTLHLDLGGLPVPINLGDQLTIDRYSATPHDRRLRLLRNGVLLYVGEGGGYGRYPDEGFEWMWSLDDREGVSLRIVDVGCGLVDFGGLARFNMALEVAVPEGQSIGVGSGLAVFLDLSAGRYLFVVKSVHEWAIRVEPPETYHAAYFMVLLR